MIERLPRAVPARPNRPEVAREDHPMRKVTQQIARDPGGWNAVRRAKVAELFDGLAADWNTRFTAEESWPCIDDAFARGGLESPVAKRWLEVGAGTGLATGRLAERLQTPGVPIDVSIGMLRRFDVRAGAPVLADAGALPVADGSVDLVVAVNAFLFPTEYDRVLAPEGALLWINSLAEFTPIHLPVDDVVSALPNSWDAIWSEAGWGLWAVVRRATSGAVGPL
jgi:SAM-dependent methyltransferase